jgi:hypothetical protein
MRDAIIDDDRVVKSLDDRSVWLACRRAERARIRTFVGQRR